MVAKKQAEPLPVAVSWKTHRLNWQSCRECSLCETRLHVALFRRFYSTEFIEFPRIVKSMQCEVLMIGEGPGESEDVTGRPFTGPAGRKLNKITDAAIKAFCKDEKTLGRYPSIGMGNIVACRPVDDRGGNRAPSALEAEACRSRLEELIVMTQPTDIICLGRIVESLFPRKFARALKTFPFLKATHSLRHPSYILQIESPTRAATEEAIMRTSLTAILKQVYRRNHV